MNVETPSATPKRSSACYSLLSEKKTPVTSHKCQCNPVGALQELVVQRKWRFPEYAVIRECGTAQRKEFTMTCKLEKCVEIGTGRSKKRARRNVANKMLSRVRNGQIDLWTSSEAEEGTRNQHTSLSCTLDTLRHSAGEKIRQLRFNPLESHAGSNFCALLDELSEEQSFGVRYIDHEPEKPNGWRQCDIELSTKPVTVSTGFAADADAAREISAYNVLRYIKRVAGG